MEEVDKIIIHSLRQVGCDIEDIESLKQFSTDMVIESAVRCLDVIQPGLGLPHTLPPNMSARFRLGASIAQACADLGYPGEIGYQTFLYSSEADVRRVFMFLIEKLPKETEKTIVGPAGGAALLEQKVAEELRRQLSAPWLPSYCKLHGMRWRSDGSWSQEGCSSCHPFISVGSLEFPDLNISKASQNYFSLHSLPITEQVEIKGQLLPSVIVTNAKLLLGEHLASSSSKWMANVKDSIARDIKTSEQTPTSKVESTQVEPKALKSKVISSEILPGVKNEVQIENSKANVADIQKHKEDALDQVRLESEDLRTQIETLQIEVKKLGAKLNQLSEERSVEERLVHEQEEKLVVKEHTYALLPQAEENLNKLQTLVDNSAQRLVGLAAQWEKHRAPLLTKYREARQRNSSRASESQKQIDSVRALRDKVRELTEEVRGKESLHTQLLADYERISKDTNTVSRSAYTRRIMEIIGNIRKQRDEIAKVLGDTRELQKEINTLSGQLERSFTVADELIFRDAKKDEVSRKAYKLLATIHSDCSELVQMVEETGATVRQIRDLEEQIESESAKNVAANLERVSADLKQMKQENTVLTVQLKNKTQGNAV